MSRKLNNVEKDLEKTNFLNSKETYKNVQRLIENIR